MQPLNFASDNASGIHPQVLAAIERANSGSAIAYGNDAWTESAIAALRRCFGAAAEVFFMFNGTGANVVGLGSIARSFEAVFCADCSHIWADECAAPEKFFGGKLIPVGSTFGKITPRAVSACMGENRGVHHVVPKVISITQATEWGTVYTPDEIRALADYAHASNMVLHMDGARLANAAASLNTSLAAITSEAGVDVVSFGGTKNGLMLGEAVIFLAPDLAVHSGYLRKQATQLASKMRFIACQFDALMSEELWRSNAEHANRLAARIADGVRDVPGVDLMCEVEINALFPRLDPRYVEPLLERSDFYLWDEAAKIARWMTSFNTSVEDVDAFIALVRDVAGRF